MPIEIRFKLHRKLLFSVGPLVLMHLVGTGVGPAFAQTAPVKPSATAKPAAAAKPVSAARQAVLARARAEATETASAVMPRYKVDASGELVPDLRAAAAIIYDPVTNQVLWEENSQTPRSIASITKV